jgi:hypothetical protein
MRFFLLAFLYTISLFAQEIDVVIPAIARDKDVLELCIESVKKYVKDCRRIIVISSDKLTDQAEWVSETVFPFTKDQVASALLKEREVDKVPSRTGWYYQQLLKFYAPFVIEGISSNVLIVDSDIVFLKKTVFFDNQETPIFYTATEYHYPYFAHMDRLLPGLKRVFKDKSGISHHMLFQKSRLEELFELVERYQGLPFWKSFCYCVDPVQLPFSGASEYEIYFNFSLLYGYPLKIRQSEIIGVSSIQELELYKNSRYRILSCQWYSRIDLVSE